MADNSCTGGCDDGFFCNGLEECVDDQCASGEDPCPKQECDEDNSACVLTGNAIRGGQLYDGWAAVLGVTPPETDHPLWEFRPDQASNTRAGGATWRCKECHGWDYKGVDGQYGSGSHRTGIRGILGTTINPSDLATLLNSLPGGRGGPDGVPNGHGYESVLSETEINDLIAFVLDGGTIDYDPYIDPVTGEIAGDPMQGQMNYMMGGCLTCHGPDGTAINFGTPEDPEFVGTVAVDNPWELFHKIRHGQPGTAMPSWIADGGTIEGVADIGRYAQDNFPVDCTEESHCNDDTLCEGDECADGLCVSAPRIYGDVNRDGTVDIFDIFCVLDGFGQLFVDCTMADMDIAGCGPDGEIDIQDIFAVLDAFARIDPCCQ